MAKLNQIIAVEKGAKAQTYSLLTELNKAAQKPDLFNGFDKKYQPVEENGEQLPPESKRVQFTVPDIIRRAENALIDFMQITERKDRTNCDAKADIKIEGALLAAGVPISHLLF